MNIWQVSVKGYPHTRAFDSVAITLQRSLRDLGIEAGIDHRMERYVKNKSGIILGAHLLHEAVSDCIIYNLEQITLDSPLVNAHYVKLLRNNTVWDYSRRNISELKKLGVEATYMPIGYHPVLEDIVAARQDIDCLFYGSINERRAAMLESVGAKVLWNYYGWKLRGELARAKIVLNCHFYETKVFEIVRCSYLLANKKFILSEPGLDEDLEAPFREGIAFHAGEEWPEAVKYYLAHPEVREKIAQKGYEIFKGMSQVEFLRGAIW